MKQSEINAIAHELGFWKGFVKTERFLKGWVANIPTPELHAETRELVRAGAGNSGRVLDVGSGVVSILNGCLPSGVTLVAADPLGPLYELIFDYHRHGIAPPVAAGVENLLSVGFFDVVHISNALDHSTDPIKGMDQMLRALVPGGLLIVCGFINESTHMAGAGMHQWDLDLEGDNQLILRDGRTQTQQWAWHGDLSYRKTLEVDGTKRDWLIWAQRKESHGGR